MLSASAVARPARSVNSASASRTCANKRATNVSSNAPTQRASRIDTNNSENSTDNSARFGASGNAFAYMRATSSLASPGRADMPVSTNNERASLSRSTLRIVSPKRVASSGLRSSTCNKKRSRVISEYGLSVSASGATLLRLRNQNPSSINHSLRATSGALASACASKASS